MHKGPTANIRLRALDILAFISEHADWRAAIGVLRVLDEAMGRIPKNERRVNDVEAFRAEWHNDRLAGLELLRTLSANIKCPPFASLPEDNCCASSAMRKTSFFARHAAPL